MNKQKDFQSAFNVVVKYGFCGDCRWKLESENCRECGFYESVKLIKEALEKQIPKKPEKNAEEIILCPSCGWFLGYELECREEECKIPYCPGCGQAIDWSKC